MKQRKALGRGLGALIPGSDNEETSVAPSGAKTRLPIEKLAPNPHQPRVDFDEEELDALTASIREVGLIQPILVSPEGEDTYRIIAGERRWRASQRAGLTEVPVVVREVTEREALAIALIENLQRVDLNPIEEALGYRRLQEEFGLTQEEVARNVGKERSTVANFLRLLKLDPTVQQLVREGQLSMGHARVLVTIQDPARQLDLANLAIDRELSVRQMEALGRASAEGAGDKAPVVSAFTSDPNVRDLLERMRRRFGTKVQVAGSNQKGKIVLEYFSADEFDRLIEQLLP